MLKNKKRKEVLLDEETISILEFQAERQGRKLKNYMEFILKEKAEDFELTDEYKLMMDEILKKHKKSQLNYISKEVFFDKIDKL
jgi:hypothetical protein